MAFAAAARLLPGPVDQISGTKSTILPSIRRQRWTRWVHQPVWPSIMPGLTAAATADA
jgi:hypothetical protein